MSANACPASHRFGLGQIMLAASLLSAVGCMSSPPTRNVARASLKVPVITPQTETKETQDKGGLKISIAPVTYTTRRDDVVSVRQVPQPQVVWARRPGEDIYVERTVTPKFGVAPENLRFVVKINNQLPRVFYGKGTVVQFNVGGRLQAVDQRGYNNFLGAIIPPRQEIQIEIDGPPVNSLTADKGIIGVFLYDVVTNQSEAGEVTEKQNFEWYFDYTLEPREEQAEGVTEQRYISFAEWQEVMVRQNQQRYQQIRQPQQ